MIRTPQPNPHIHTSLSVLNLSAHIRCINLILFGVFIVVCIRGVSITEKLYFLLKKLLFGYLCLANEVSKYLKTFLSETFSHLIVLRYQNVTIFLSF